MKEHKSIKPLIVNTIFSKDTCNNFLDSDYIKIKMRFKGD